MRFDLTRLSIADTRHPIATHDQLGGSGIVRNKALAIPGHLNFPNGTQEGPWASVEYVSLDPGEDNAIGEHLQETEEIYVVLHGEGLLTTNERPLPINAGTVVIAPVGTLHGLCNLSEYEPLTFLVVELQAPDAHLSAHRSPALRGLAPLCPGTTFAPVRLRGTVVFPRTATINLAEHFAGPWGTLSEVELPPGARVDESCDTRADRLFLLGGFLSAIVTKRSPEQPGEQAEEIRVDATGEGYQCVVVPAGVSCRLENRASGDLPASLWCLHVLRTEHTDFTRVAGISGKEQ